MPLSTVTSTIVMSPTIWNGVARHLYKKELGNLPGFKVYKSVANFILIKYPVEIKDALMEALKVQDYKIKFMGDKGLESCLRITLGRKEQTQTVVDTILKVLNEK